MATLCLTLEEIENLFREVACAILGIPDTDNKSVRFPYGSTPDTGSAPGVTRDMDVCFIYVIPTDDGYGQQNHTSSIPDSDPNSDMMTKVNEYTDIYDVRFAFYGPRSFERARNLKDGLRREDIRSLLKKNGFYLRSGIPPLAPVREIKDGEWWMRHDVVPRFYSYVRIETPGAIMPIENVKISTLN